jgi:hypothetical protein
MSNYVLARSELLEDLEAPGLFHDHLLAPVVDVTSDDDEAIRHAPDELALVDGQRDELFAVPVRALADELHLLFM